MNNTPSIPAAQAPAGTSPTAAPAGAAQPRRPRGAALLSTTALLAAAAPLAAAVLALTPAPLAAAVPVAAPTSARHAGATLSDGLWHTAVPFGAFSTMKYPDAGGD
jgi:hypothetical protein